jgi:hypothetical protein
MELPEMASPLALVRVLTLSKIHFEVSPEVVLLGLLPRVPGLVVEPALVVLKEPLESPDHLVDLVERVPPLRL